VKHAHVRTSIASATLLATLTVAPAVLAQSAEKAAQAAFDQGLELMKQHKLAEACPKLEESQRLDPGMGTAFRLAECYEGLGRLARAWTLYRSVIAEAQAKKEHQREAFAKKRSDALEPKLGRMTVTVSAAIAGMPGLSITRDGEEIARADWGAVARVDPGAHTVRAIGPGKKAWETRTADAQPGTNVDVVVPALEDAGDGAGTPAGAPPASATPVAGAPGAHRSMAPAIVLGGAAAVGVVLGVTGMVLYAGQRGTATDLQTSLHGNPSACSAASPPAACAQLGSAWSTATTFENLGLWGFVGAGAAGAATLAYALWPAPQPGAATSHLVRVVPELSAGRAGVLVSGTF